MFVTLVFIIFLLTDLLENILILELHFSWLNNDNETPEKDN